MKLSTHRCYVAGHRGLVGSAIVRALRRRGVEPITRSRGELDLRDRGAVFDFFSAHPFECVFLVAGRVGGISPNSRQPVQFLLENLQLQNNVIEACYHFGVQKLLFTGSSCIYPKNAAVPIREEMLLTGPLEETNEAYAIAKIAGIKLCQAYQRQYDRNFICCMPTNLYGPEDNFDLENAHVLPALLRKFHEAVQSGAEEVVLWGTGTPRREFLYVDDLAEASLFLMEHYDAPEIINVGTGEDISIRELALLLARITGFQGSLRFDSSRPDGVHRKVLDVSKIRQLGWSPHVSLEVGLRQTHAWYQERLQSGTPMRGFSGWPEHAVPSAVRPL